MSELVELTFEGAAITARFADGTAREVADLGHAGQILSSLSEAHRPVPMAPGSPEDVDRARKAAQLAGMQVEERGGQWFLLRPGLPEALLHPPGDGPLVLPPPAPAQRVFITLGPNSLFTSLEPAYARLISTLGHRAPPRRYHNFGSDTFLRCNSTALGRVQSLYRDLRLFGFEPIGVKLRHWVEFVRASDDPVERQFVGWFDRGVSPLDLATLRDPKLVMPYFKAYALLRLFRERGDQEPVGTHGGTS